ncbi:FecCD family ABC transporter permease [Falsirhodobacter xinxiangensis]|uniref:FecCD family ABC transporter permease n=1 Tax=Falsirhodobacter xinxiangensis TaxID=2530049 RepID=UPI0010A9C545|nr:iron ABC transporter permease [Rhodobacter xinxiangensis]
MTLTLRMGRISLPISLRFVIAAPLLLLALIASAYLALGVGSSVTAPADVLAAILSPREALSPGARAIADFRLPRVQVAIMAGAMMAASGYLLQVVSRNGLADPGILGLSDGATVAVMLVTFLYGPIAVGQLGLVSLVGAVATAGLVLGLGRRLLTGGGIILVGLSINIVLGAVVEMILVSGTSAQFAQIMTWSRGTLGTADGPDAAMMARWFCLLMPVLLLGSRMLHPLLLGEEAAMALGLPARAVLVAGVLLAAAFAAPVIAVCGPIGFIGLMSAWIARGIVGERPTEVVLIAMPVGAGILLWADTLGRVLFSPITVSAGIMVSVVGALSFILVARTGRRSRASS